MARSDSEIPSRRSNRHMLPRLEPLLIDTTCAEVARELADRSRSPTLARLLCGGTGQTDRFSNDFPATRDAFDDRRVWLAQIEASATTWADGTTVVIQLIGHGKVAHAIAL